MIKQTLILMLSAVFLLGILPLSMAGSLTSYTDTFFLYTFDNSLVANVGDYKMELQAGTTTYNSGQDESGKSALYFDGSTYYESNDSVTHMINTDLLTELVFMCNDTNTRYDLLRMDSGNPQNSFIQLANDSYWVQVRDQNGDSHNFISNFSACNGEWQYIVWQIDNTLNNFSVFKNGSLVYYDSLNADAGMIWGATQISLGASPSGANDADETLISEFMVTENKTLSPGEVVSRYSVLLETAPFNYSESLLAYWHLEETEPYYKTSIGNQTLYNLTGNNTETSRADGLIGFSQEFNGTNSSCSTCSKLKTIKSIDFDKTKDLSISLWFKTSNLSSERTLISHKVTDTNQFYISLLNDTETIYLNYHQGGACNHTDTENLSDYSIDPDDNDWHHVVLTANWSSNTIQRKLYVDGQTIISTGYGCTSLPSSNTRPINIGSRSNSNYWTFKGFIDEVAVWKPRTLTPSDVLSLYNFGNGILFDDNVLSLDFYNFSVSTAMDLYNFSYVLSQGDDVILNSFVVDDNVDLIVENGTYNLSVSVVNDSDFITTNIYDMVVAGTTSDNVFFYDLVRTELSFKDLSSGDDVLDNVSVSFFDDQVYSGYSDNGTLIKFLYNDFYDIIATVLNNSDYERSELFGQNVSNLSTISGTVPYQNFTLFFFNNSGSGANNITATIYNQIASPIEDAILQIQRRDENGNYVLIQQVTSNFEGETRFQANLNTDFYKFLVYYEGELRFKSNATRLYSDTINLFINTADFPGTSFFLLNEFNHRLKYNPDTLLSELEWTGLTGLNNRICLNVTKTDGKGFITRLNSSCSTGESGSISIQLVNQTERTTVDIMAYLYTETGSEEKNLLAGKSVYFPGQDLTEGLGVFLTIFLVIAVSFGLGWKHPFVIPVVSTGTLMLTGLFGLHIMSPALTGSFFILGIVVTVWLSGKK